MGPHFQTSAANKSGSEAIHSTGLHDIFNSGFGEACDEERPASQCGCAACRSRSISWSSSSCSGIFVLLGMRFALFPRWSIILFSLLCSCVCCRVVPAVARYYRPSLMSVGLRSPRLPRGLVAGFCTQGRWRGLLAEPSFSPSSPSSSTLLSFAGALSCWCVLPWALWVSRPLCSLSFEGSLWSSFPVFSRSPICCTLSPEQCSLFTCS